MMLTLEAHGDKIGYKRYRFACFDTCCKLEKYDFEINFNKALEALRTEMFRDRELHDETLHMINVWLS